jgi:aconitate hydratase
MSEKPKREADDLTHSKPGSVDQQAEDSFPASDSPSFSPGAVGAPTDRETKPKTSDSSSVKAAEKKVKDGDAKKPHTY